MSERKNPELDAQHQAILRKMMQLPENRTCADCKGPSPRWASTNLGVFLCIACSGIHRKLGTHISQVRSISLDTWTPAQVARFQKLGNAKAAQYFEACVPPDFRRPASGDSMQMESFIREKYEMKRFITVENGGLGGSAPTHTSRRHSSYEMSGSASRVGSQGTMGRRPLQGTGGYDDASSRGIESSISSSYGDRFREGTALGKYNSGRGIGSGARPKNAIQRAHTLKEIMNMGFPAQLAARAVEAGEGDLQRAVDWVLENSDSQSAYTPQPERPVRQTVEQDLLDFGEPEPRSTSEAARPPNSIGKQSLVAQKVEASSPSKPTQDDFADFADFGAFESALPAHTDSSVTTTTTSKPVAKIGNGSLSGSIASLYAQVPAKATNQISNGMSQHKKTQPVPHRPDQLQSKSPKMLSPQLSGRPFPKGPISRETPGTIPSFTWQTSNKTASPVRTSPTLTSRLSSAIVHNAARKKSPTSLSPPPPPPMAELSISKVDVPSPRNSPTPKEAFSVSSGRASSAAVVQTAPPEGPDAPTPHMQHETAESTESETKKDPEKEEDPFAALSMLALSSATAKKKPVKKQAVTNSGVAEKETIPNETSVPVSNASAGINLDDLFG